MRVVWIAGGLVFAALGLSGCEKMQESKLLAVCESVLKDRLKSPSSYKRVETVQSRAPMRRVDFMEQNPDATELDFKLFDEKPYTVWKVIIKYDADNSFGASIRDVAVCEYVEDYSFNPSELYVKVNGYTKNDFFIKRLTAE
jgi:hypothetical protein